MIVMIIYFNLLRVLKHTYGYWEREMAKRKFENTIFYAIVIDCLLFTYLFLWLIVKLKFETL